ncbi:MAG: ribonuclease J [Chloroflexi bacterium]|nr:MAG: ribonuclease J [Chloroflexota bacterium]TMB92405.1 MAG: ribonuclease J [Chloroflexota bacterium]TMC31107.1 MAG: ribonuclease J [Chloroflexota bacterium]TMC33570.1 MAG: ribonuclease J [Chloroflexota bacterium]TMC56304.1 MAG: ribonuclease J [Chloroflexota bacterium]
MLALEQGDDIVVIDAGLMFPDEEMLGIDLVIPDITYLKQNKKKVRGIVLTHAHEDHMGALPYVLRDLPDVPIYGTKLTLGLMRTKLREHKLADKVDAREFAPGSPFKVGAFACDSYAVCHSIPDAVGITLETRYGTVVHSGDWKFDHTPVDGRQTDFAKLSAVAAKGVLLLMSDSTRAEVAGYTQSERHVGELFDAIMARAPGRVITTTFASNISRIKQIIELAAGWGRRTAIIGRSMENYTRTARELGYFSVPEGSLIHPKEIDKLPDSELCIITTGSQGEPTSALSRMALGDHRHVVVKEGDTVVMSATPIPGNEELVSRTVDNLFKLGAEVVYDPQVRPHVSGHASQEELKLLLNILRPRYFVPIHGEYRMLVRHARLAIDLGVRPENAFVVTNGDVVEVDGNGARLGNRVPSGVVYVDGLGVGDVSESVMRDRWSIGSDGIFLVVISIDRQTAQVVGGPDIVTKGFVPEENAADLADRVRQRILDGLAEVQSGEHLAEVATIRDTIHDTVASYLYERTKRRPMVLPVIMQV